MLNVGLERFVYTYHSIKSLNYLGIIRDSEISKILEERIDCMLKEILF